MEWVKTTAKTLPEAIDLALDNLGVDESDAEIVVLEEPRSGLFGRTKGTARVEARVKPKQSRPKQEKRKTGGRNKSRNDRGDRPGRSDGAGGRNRSRSKPQDGGGQNRSQQSRGQGQNRSNQNNQAESESGSAAASGNQAVENTNGKNNSGGSGRDDGNSRGQSGGRSRGGRGSGGSGGRNKRNSEDNGRSENRPDAGPKVETPVEDVKNHLQEFLTGLTGAFGFDDPVTVDESPEDGLTGQVPGQHGLMVGPKGRTLDAIQELARISSSRKVPSSVRIKVDVGGYRAQRTVALGEFAAKAADNAVENSTEVALDPMSAADRKAVHDALSDDDRVETRSVGTDPRRKVLVVPVAPAGNEDDQDNSGEDLVEASNADSSVSED